MIELFQHDAIIGVFRGFSQGGLEFRADLAIPYRDTLHNIPMHGQYVLVQLENPDEAVLGRITSLASEGRLASNVGEDYSIRAVRDDRPVPEQLRQDYLKYRVSIRVLGIVRSTEASPIFVPSHRRLPHVGSPVAFVPPEVLRVLLGHDGEGAPLGVFALGEYVYSGNQEIITVEDWMQVLSPDILVRFPVHHLVSRRTFVFARAGFGKSNLNKLLFSRLYHRTPMIRKGGNRDVPVGTVIFDPEGEYFWPDDKGRPGLCDVPELADQVVVFTSREAPSDFYGSFIAGGIKLDVRRLSPSDVISIGLPPERQDQQNVRKLRGMNPDSWQRLVDLVYADGNSADLHTVQDLLRLEADQQAEALAARANMTTIVRMLHDPGSQLMDLLLEALSEGKLCVIDVSQLRGGPSLILSGLILRRIFDWNQEEFTRARPRTIPTIAVVEEAQSVLNEKSSAAAPYIEWVKEGRKYDLGAMLITQQPGSIPTEILSQGDNWFIFHLLSASDLQNVRRANAHFSDDLLSSLLNEPIKGQGLFWSSEGGAEFPIPLRVASFEKQFPLLDPNYDKDSFSTYASRLRERFQEEARQLYAGAANDHAAVDATDETESEGESRDLLAMYQAKAIASLSENREFLRSVESSGIPWGVVVGMLSDALPSTIHDRNSVAYGLVPRALTEILGGPQDGAWETEYRESRTGKRVLFVKKR